MIKIRILIASIDNSSHTNWFVCDMISVLPTQYMHLISEIRLSEYEISLISILTKYKKPNSERHVQVPVNGYEVTRSMRIQQQLIISWDTAVVISIAIYSGQ
jgi:hypothetical protein